MRTLTRILIVSLAILCGAAALPACVEVDLGDEPLLCNPGTPRCPKDYACVVEDDGSERCVRAAGARPSAGSRTDAS